MQSDYVFSAGGSADWMRDSTPQNVSCEPKLWCIKPGTQHRTEHNVKTET